LTDDTKNRSATITPWVIFQVANLT